MIARVLPRCVFAVLTALSVAAVCWHATAAFAATAASGGLHDCTRIAQVCVCLLLQQR
jgi:hypothetical protein